MTDKNLKKLQEIVEKLTAKETDSVVQEHLKQVSRAIEATDTIKTKRLTSKRLEEQAKQSTIQEFETKLDEIQKTAVKSRLRESWIVDVKTPKKIRVRFTEHATKQQAENNAEYALKRYLTRLQENFPNLSFESFNPSVTHKGIPTFGKGDFLIEFFVKYDKKKLF